MSEIKFFAGIDLGTKSAKGAVLSADGEPREFFEEFDDPFGRLAELLEQTEVAPGSAMTGLTGAGRSLGAGGGALKVTEAMAAGLALAYLHPGVRAAVDVGTEEVRVVLTDGAGRVLDMAVNDKCASGSGSFIEAMARVFSLSPEEFGAAGLSAKGGFELNSRCAVFAESEVVGLIHQNIPGEEIARAVHGLIAQKCAGMIKRLGDFKEVALFGGLARNGCFAKCLSENIGGAEVLVDANSTYAGALGAALAVRRRANRG